MSQPRVTFTDDRYRFEWEPEQVTMMLDRLQEHRSGGVSCELTIESTAEIAPGILFPGLNFNLSTNNAAFVNKLKSRREDVDWDALLTQMAGIAKARYRDGEPLVDLATVEPSEITYLLRPFVAQPGATTIAGDGGSGKSMLALAMALSVASGLPLLGEYPEQAGAVVYLDWEADASTHSERLRALCRGIAPDMEPPAELIHYQEMTASLHEAAPALRNKLLKIDPVLIVVDSVGLARGGSPESAEDTIRFFTAVRSLKRPVLCIDHISKASIQQKGGRKDSIGSVYTRNASRLAWSMESAQREQSDEMVVVLNKTKGNRGRQGNTRSYVMAFDEDASERLVSVSIKGTDIRDVPELHQPSNKWTIAAYLDEIQQSATVSAIAEGTDLNPATVRQQLNDSKGDLFTQIPGTRPPEWGRLTGREEGDWRV